MSVHLSFIDRLRMEVMPTLNQALSSIVLSVLVLILPQSQTILGQLGITQTAINAGQDQFLRFEAILRSPVTSFAALITFWAIVGLVAYLVCWGVMNILTEARNEVTLATEYTNRGHWRGPYETLALKSFAGVGLALVIGSLWYGMSFWIALSLPVFSHPEVGTIVNAGLGIIGLAFQLYLLLMFIQLTFTPWYRVQTFTDV